MERKSLFLRWRLFFSFYFLVMGFHHILSAQLTLHLPQNVFIPGEQMWYGIGLDDRYIIDNQLPIIHTTLYDNEGHALYRSQSRLTQKWFTQHVNIPTSISSGSYILTCSIHDEFNYKVLQEHSEVIHVLADEIGVYFTFDKNVDAYAETLSNSVVEIPSRTRRCTLSELDEGIVSVSSNDLSLERSNYQFSLEDGTYQKEQKHRFFIDESNDKKWLALYNNKQRKVHIADINENNGEFILSLQDSYFDEVYQAINAYDGSNISKLILKYPAPLWMTQKRSKVNMDSDKIDLLRNKSINKLRISQIYHSNDNRKIDSLVNSVIPFPEPDKLIDFQNFDAFESIELFIKEAITSVKLLSNRDRKELLLVHGDKRGFFSGPPLLIIDGSVEVSIDSLLSIPFSDFEKIEIYRTRAKLEPSFKLLGNNGVLVVSTSSRQKLRNRNIRINGMKTTLEYKNLSPERIADTRPFISGLQDLRWHQGGKFCYDHNDEVGIFHLDHFDLKNQELRNIQIIKVSISND